VFLVFLLSFCSLFCPFCQKQALNQEGGGNSLSDASVINIQEETPRCGKYHPFHCPADDWEQGRLMCTFRSKVAESEELRTYERVANSETGGEEAHIQGGEAHSQHSRFTVG